MYSGLTLRLIRAGMDPPTGLLLIYPYLDVKQNNATPSYFANYDNAMLPNAVMQLIPTTYLNNENRNTNDPFISPILASDELISKLPPIRIMIGTKDPLYDENMRFLSRLMYLYF